MQCTGWKSKNCRSQYRFNLQFLLFQPVIFKKAFPKYWKFKNLEQNIIGGRAGKRNINFRRSDTVIWLLSKKAPWNAWSNTIVFVCRKEPVFQKYMKIYKTLPNCVRIFTWTYLKSKILMYVLISHRAKKLSIH